MTTQTNVAEIILQQLGGNRFVAMTGARDFCNWNNEALSFRIPRAKGGINRVEVRLNASDTYTLTFSKFRSLELQTVEQLDGVYADQLASIFTATTGLHTSL